jgi:hypothetical protein
MNFVSGLWRIIGLLFLAALLPGCSAIKLAYNNIDDVAYWWLDAYVDFSDEQSQRVREDLGRLHRWHRADELPKFAALLPEIERAMPGDITPAQACGFVDKAYERVDALANRAEPAIVTIALGLDATQLQHLEGKYRKNNADYRKEWVQAAPDEQAEKRFRQYLERSEMIYGRLDEPQRAILRKQAAQSAFDPQRVLAERQRRQADILQTLRKVTAPGQTLADARVLVHGMLERARRPADPSGRAYVQSFTEEGCRNLAGLHNGMNAGQRDAAVRRLRAYQRELRDLMAGN